MYAINTNAIDKISLATTPASNEDTILTVLCDSCSVKLKKSEVSGSSTHASTTALQLGGTTRHGETKNTNLPVFANVCWGGERKPIDSDSAGSKLKTNFGTIISENYEFNIPFYFAEPAVDIPISKQTGGDVVTSASIVSA